jgi:hypothetical protein
MILEKINVKVVKKFPAFYATQILLPLHKCLPVIPTLSQQNPISNFKPYFSKISDFIQYTPRCS